jgi:hypothetical protein
MSPGDTECVKRRRPTRRLAAIASVAVVLTAGAGGWSIWKLPSENGGRPETRTTVLQRIEVRQAPGSAAEQNLAARPDTSPLDAPVRAAVGPALTRDELSELEVTLNLMFMSGETSAQAVGQLIDHGMAPEVARKLIRETWPLLN